MTQISSLYLSKNVVLSHLQLSYLELHSDLPQLLSTREFEGNLNNSKWPNRILG